MASQISVNSVIEKLSINLYKYKHVYNFLKKPRFILPTYVGKRPGFLYFTFKYSFNTAKVSKYFENVLKIMYMCSINQH